MEIRERKVVVTGANRGIGRALCEMFAESGAHLHLVVRRRDPEFVEELQRKGALSVRVSEANLEDSREVTRLIEELNHQGKDELPVDILVNNAGQLTAGLLENQDIEEILRMFAVNVNALIQLTHGLLPGMLARRRGKIVNNSSVLAVLNLPAVSTYAASKAAVVAFTRALSEEVRGTGVSTLLLLTPGVDTRMLDAYSESQKKYFSFSVRGMPAARYAQIVREAILEDLDELRPQGLSGLGLIFAQCLPNRFLKLAGFRFHRS